MQPTEADIIMKRFHFGPITTFFILFVHVLQSASFTFAQAFIDSDVPPYMHDASGVLNGELKKWHKLTLGFVGPETSETNNVTNPFTDYRLDVTFKHGSSQKSYIVPGYYACDGNAANSGADSGAVWLVHFAPDEEGSWDWEATFLQGKNIAQADDPAIEGISGLYFDKSTGSFEIEATDKTGRDHRGKGRLQVREVIAMQSEELPVENSANFLLGLVC